MNGMIVISTGCTCRKKRYSARKTHSQNRLSTALPQQSRRQRESFLPLINLSPIDKMHWYGCKALSIHTFCVNRSKYVVTAVIRAALGTGALTTSSAVETSLHTAHLTGEKGTVLAVTLCRSWRLYQPHRRKQKQQQQQEDSCQHTEDLSTTRT